MAPPRATLASLGEFGFLEGILADLGDASKDVTVGPGDDCAAVRSRGDHTLLTIDALVEGVHFESDWLTPLQIGARAFAVNASDVAAMGGQPRWVLVAFNAPAALPVRDLRDVQRGIVNSARAAGAAVVGGNLTQGDRLAVTIAMVGESAHRPLRRSGARVGDAIYVTGTIGDSAVGLQMLMKRVSADAAMIRRFSNPTPRLRAGRELARLGIASAAIDVSDGLLQDLGHLCRASGVGAEIQSSKIPLSSGYRRVYGADASMALRGGEDYELMFTVPRAKIAKLERAAPSFGCRITQVGIVVRGAGVAIDGQAADSEGVGFDHFGTARPPTMKKKGSTR